jgi:hypothetical protein
MIPLFERVKTVHALDGAATVIGHIAIVPKPKYGFLVVAILCHILFRKLLKHAAVFVNIILFITILIPSCGMCIQENNITTFSII